MGKKVFLSLLAGILMACALMPLPVSAWSDPDDTSLDLVIEDNETSISGNVSMTVGKEKDLAGYIQYGVRNEDAGDQWYLTGTIRWASSNPDIVSVSGQGIAIAHRVGTAKVTATGWDNIGRKHVQSIVVGVSRGGNGNSNTTTNSFELSEGTWLCLRQLGELHSASKEIRWASSVPDIASVDSDGLVLAHSVGRCTVTASYVDGNGVEQTIKYRIRVTSIILSGQMSSSTVMLKEGDEIDLGMLYYPNYQSLSRALDQFSCTTGSNDILSVNSLSVSATSAGSGSVLIREADRTDDVIRHKLTIVVKT